MCGMHKFRVVKALCACTVCMPALMDGFGCAMCGVSCKACERERIEMHCMLEHIRS